MQLISAIAYQSFIYVGSANLPQMLWKMKPDKYWASVCATKLKKIS